MWAYDSDLIQKDIGHSFSLNINDLVKKKNYRNNLRQRIRLFVGFQNKMNHLKKENIFNKFEKKKLAKTDHMIC